MFSYSTTDGMSYQYSEDRMFYEFSTTSLDVATMEGLRVGDSKKMENIYGTNYVRDNEYTWIYQYFN